MGPIRQVVESQGIDAEEMKRECGGRKKKCDEVTLEICFVLVTRSDRLCSMLVMIANPDVRFVFVFS